MIVGPAMPSAITFMWFGAPALANSSSAIAWWLYGSPRPPYSSGHVRPAKPASNSLRLHARPGSAGRFSASHARTRSRKAASSGLSCRSTTQNLEHDHRADRVSRFEVAQRLRSFLEPDPPTHHAREVELSLERPLREPREILGRQMVAAVRRPDGRPFREEVRQVDFRLLARRREADQHRTSAPGEQS